MGSLRLVFSTRVTFTKKPYWILFIQVQNKPIIEILI